MATQQVATAKPRNETDLMTGHQPIVNRTDQPVYSCPEDFVMYNRICYNWKNISKRILNFYQVNSHVHIVSLGDVLVLNAKLSIVIG